MNTVVSVRKCEEYNAPRIEELLAEQLSECGVDTSLWRGRRIVIKPNLVVASKADAAACTHPSVVEAVAGIAVRAGGEVIIAESPGGPFSEASIKHNYRVNGLYPVSERTGARLNLDTGFRKMSAPDAKTSKNFNIITPICDADIILNVCKLKTHTLTGMTCAVKNLFGTVPGTQKVEMHARFSNQQRFGDALIDLCDMLCRAKTVINICDAIVGMEGNGPSGGSPRKVGALLVSESPFALDRVASRLIGHEGEVPMVEDAKKRGLCPQDDEITVLGDDPVSLAVPDYLHSDAKRGRIFSILPPFLQPRPSVIESSCVGCGRCSENCPANAIKIKERAEINRKLCIKCFCCQELCPVHAVEIKKNFLFSIIK